MYKEIFQWIKLSPSARLVGGLETLAGAICGLAIPQYPVECLLLIELLHRHRKSVQ